MPSKPKLQEERDGAGEMPWHSSLPQGPWRHPRVSDLLYCHSYISALFHSGTNIYGNGIEVLNVDLLGGPDRASFDQVATAGDLPVLRAAPLAGVHCVPASLSHLPPDRVLAGVDHYHHPELLLRLPPPPSQAPPSGPAAAT